MHYRIKAERDDNGTYLITSPDFPEVTSFAEKESDIGRIGLSAIEEAICARMADKEPIPTPHKATKSGVRLGLTAALKVQLYSELLSSGLKRYSFGKKIGLKATQIDRLFDIRYSSKIESLEAALSALNLEPEVSLRRLA